jgi:hypothetical protein
LGKLITAQSPFLGQNSLASPFAKLNYPITKLLNLPNLLNFFVRRVLATALAELLELKTAGGGLLVLGRRIVPLFAVAAL